MCGIVGAIELNPKDIEERVSLANDNLSHRGPDGSGIESFETKDKTIVFAHSRLSIIDLSELGHQPMSSKNGEYWLTFNGEIYNYKEIREDLIELGYTFESDTDTEVLLTSWIEWGEACLTRLIGMFAFAIYDKTSNSFHLARDAFGIKPCYYYSKSDKFYFSSEVPALYSLIPGKLNLDKGSIINYLLRSSYDAGEFTFAEEIKALKPGSIITIDLNLGLAVSERTWWEPKISEDRKISFEEASDKLRELFLKSIRLHLRSDVPLGAALSGGIDSSAIVCAMRYLEPDLPIHTFSYIASNTSVNEEKWVDLVNNHVNATPHKLELSFEDLSDDLNSVIESQGEPFGSTSIYAQYRIFQLAKSEGITVMLEGQGADELLGGYFGYPEHTAWSYLDNKDFSGLLRFARHWAKQHGKSEKFIKKFILRKIIMNSLKSVSDTIKSMRGLFKLVRPNTERISSAKKPPNYLTKRLFPIEIPDWITRPSDGMELANSQLNAGVDKDDPKGRRLVFELRRSLKGHHQAGLNSLLRHGDRNAMKWSIEGRVPFLTIEIAEFVLSLPEHYLVSKEGLTKNVFREAMRGIVPDEILDRKDKVGFETPEQEWTSRMEVDWISDVLSKVSFLDERRIQERTTNILENKEEFSWFAWRSINFASWLKINKNKFHLGS